MRSLFLPLPDVTELNDVPEELADVIQLLDVPAAPLPAAIVKDARASGDSVQVEHLDDPRTSMLALFC